MRERGSIKVSDGPQPTDPLLGNRGYRDSADEDYFHLDRCQTPVRRTCLAISQLSSSLVKGALRVFWCGTGRGKSGQLKKSPCGPSTVAPESTQLIYEMPSIRVADFVGRQDALQELHTHFSTSAQRPRCVVLQGMAGLGKSQLAIEYARKYHSDVPYYSAVFWVDATNQKSVEDSFSQIANVARPGKCPQSTTAKIAFVKKFLKERNENWLLIFDNYDDLSSFDHIRSFFPQGHAGHILVTSRTSGSDPLGTVIPLGPMNSDDAVRLLFRRSHENPVEQHQGHTEKIVNELGCLPLAIDQAGAFIWSKRLSPCDFLGYYASQKETVFRCTPDLRRYCRTMEETGQDLDGTLSVFTTLELSFRQIARSTEEEESGIRQLLLVSAFLDRSNIPETLFKRTAEAGDLEWQWAVGADRTWDSAKFQSAMETLSNLSLIQGFSVTKDTAIFSLHPLVQVWAKLRLETAEQSAFTLKAVSLVASFIAADRNSLTPGDTKRNMLLHVDACAKNARESLEENSYFVNENLVDAAETFGWFYDSHGRYNDSAEQYERAVDVSTKTCGPEHVATLRRIEGLALVRRNQGQYAESDRLYRFALRAREKSVGFKHPEVLWTVHQLGIVTRRLGRYAEAEELYRRALAGNEERLGRDNVETLRTAEGLAIVKLNRGHFAEAEAIYMSAFYACGAQLGPSHLETLRKAEGAAIAKRHRGKYREAEQLHRCALQAREKHLGPVHPETLKTVHNLALTQRMRGFLEIALDLHSRALEGSQEQLGPEHPETLRMMEGLGVANRLLGHHDASHELLSYALHFSEEQLGRHHPDTLRKAESLANLHLSLSQFTEALQLHRRAYETFKRDLEARHPATLRAGNNLAVSLFKLGYLEEAESICTEALGDREAALDGDVADPDVLVLMHNLAAIKSGVGRGFRAEEAKELSAKVLVAIGQAKEECVYFPLMTKTQDLIVLEPC